jgi:hypothetical protein
MKLIQLVLGTLIALAGSVSASTVNLDVNRHDAYAATPIGQAIESAGVGQCIDISGRYLADDDDDPYTVNLVTFAQEVFHRVPADWDGLAMVDLEGKLFGLLKDGDPKAVDVYLKVLGVAQSVRPAAQWGFFRVPLNPPGWGAGLRLRTFNAPIHRLIDAVDVLYVGLYHPEDFEREKATVQHALDLARDDQKVVVYVSWVEKVQASPVRYAEVPDEVWSPFIGRLFRYEVNGRTIYAVVGWGNVRWLCEQGAFPITVQHTDVTDADYAESRWVHYIDRTQQAAKAAQVARQHRQRAVALVDAGILVVDDNEIRVVMPVGSN